MVAGRELRLGKYVDRGDETIAPARNGLDKTRIVRSIAQSRAKFLDRGVQAVIEGNIGVRRPELLLNFFARNELAGALKQQGQYLEGLVLQANLQPAFCEYALANISLV